MRKASLEKITFRAGRFAVSLNTDDLELRNTIPDFYHLLSDDIIPDFTVTVARKKTLFSIFKPRLVFSFSHQTPFNPLPKSQAFPLLEWGLNWCVYKHFHEALVIHAAVLEKKGVTIILPGEPGAGKSTLTAMLTFQMGWRLLSDELTLVDLESGLILPNPRCISLKNESIKIVKQRCKNAQVSSTAHDTNKGDVALVKAPENSQKLYDDHVSPSLLIFPQYIANSENGFNTLTKADAALRLINQTYNYSVLGEEGFHALDCFIKSVECLELQYGGDVNYVESCIEELVNA